MSRRPQDFKDRRPEGVKEMREAREKADAERRRSFERFREQHGWTSVTEAGASELKKSLPRCRVVTGPPGK